MMKRYIVLTMVLLFTGCAWLLRPGGPGGLPGEMTLYAQTLPITKTVEWDANPATDEVTHYTVRVNAQTLPPVTVGTSAQVTFTTEGTHVLAVSATNAWGTSAETTLTVNVRLPGNPGKIRIRP